MKKFTLSLFLFFCMMGFGSYMVGTVHAQTVVPSDAAQLNQKLESMKALLLELQAQAGAPAPTAAAVAARARTLPIKRSHHLRARFSRSIRSLPSSIGPLRRIPRDSVRKIAQSSVIS